MKRSTEICLIAPSESLAVKAKSIIAQMNEKIDIHVAAMEEASKSALALIEQGARVFISRKGTKAFLEQSLNVPVVGISTSLSDYVSVIQEIQDLKGRVAFFTYEPLSEDVLLICRILNLDVRNYRFTGVASGESCVLSAIKDGCCVGIGGATTAPYAQKHGLRHLVIENSSQTIAEAIETAKQLLHLQKEEQKKQDELKLRLKRYELIFNYTYDGIIAIDADGKIDVLNPIAEQIIHNPKIKPFVGKHINTVLPNTRLDEVLRTGEAEINQLMEINGTLIATNRVPILVDGQKKGVVATFRDVKQLQAAEHRIRIQMHEKRLTAKYHFSDIVGDSPAIEKAKRIARTFSSSVSTVLIRGETGTGKELFAQSIHNESPRKQAQFVAINCAALPKNLLEAELFGYVGGAFTGALKGGKAGVFELAHGGTIFLDEIGELDLGTQMQLLRVLQEREIRRIGSDYLTPVDIRIIAATNRDLEKAVAKGTFRQDLFYRLNVLNIHLPALRDRGDDIYHLAAAIIQKLEAPYSPETNEQVFEILRHFDNYEWPGNVRELHNVVERTMILLKSGMSANEITDAIGQAINLQAETRRHLPGTQKSGDLEEWERQQIISALQENHLNILATAKALGISRTTLWRKIQKYQINV